MKGTRFDCTDGIFGYRGELLRSLLTHYGSMGSLGLAGIKREQGMEEGGLGRSAHKESTSDTMLSVERIGRPSWINRGGYGGSTGAE
jgi:hypothetical protein